MSTWDPKRIDRIRDALIRRRIKCSEIDRAEEAFDIESSSSDTWVFVPADGTGIALNLTTDRSYGELIIDRLDDIAPDLLARTIRALDRRPST